MFITTERGHLINTEHITEVNVQLRGVAAVDETDVYEAVAYMVGEHRRVLARGGDADSLRDEVRARLHYGDDAITDQVMARAREMERP